MTLKKEIWYQDSSDQDLWVNKQGLEKAVDIPQKMRWVSFRMSLTYL